MMEKELGSLSKGPVFLVDVDEVGPSDRLRAVLEFHVGVELHPEQISIEVFPRKIKRLQLQRSEHKAFVPRSNSTAYR